MRPQRRQPTRLPRPWDPPGKNTGAGCHFLLQCMKVKSESEVAQSCPTPSNPMDCSLPGSSIHGIFQAKGLEWVAIAFSCHSLGGLKHRPFFSHSSGVWGVQDQGAGKFSFWWESLPSWQPSASRMYTHSHGKDRESPSALEVVRQSHRLNGHEFDQTLGDSGRQRSLVCYSPWSHKELDATWQLNDNSHIMTSTLMTSSSPNYCLKAPRPNDTGA